MPPIAACVLWLGKIMSLRPPERSRRPALGPHVGGRPGRRQHRRSRLAGRNIALIFEKTSTRAQALLDGEAGTLVTR
jgi:hypothetical protein